MKRSREKSRIPKSAVIEKTVTMLTSGMVAVVLDIL